MRFFQTPPELANQFDSDTVLRSFLERHLPEKTLHDILPDLQRFGARVATELRVLAEEAETHPPVHVPYDAWGRRIDEVRVSSAWEKLHQIAAQEGIVAIGYERKYAEFSRLYQFAKLYLFHPSSAIYSCPLAMTDGAARVLELHGTPEMKARAYQFLTSRDPQQFWTSGQWMTERTGGSDVSLSETVAKLENGQYRLYGVKWFTSATTSQMAMTLARIEGESKLSMFYVELRDQFGALQNIQINRLKDKLGTRALPTAELTLGGTPATLVGEAGKGVKTIATLFNITRVYNACCAIGYMRRGLALALDYSKKREAFGKKLIEHGAHLETLSQLQVRFEACFHLTFHAVKLLGKEEMQLNTPNESATLRLLIPLIKLYTAKEGVSIASEILESFGGAGYVEDTHLPALLRNAQVLAIWEGTTNVLALDALRAIRKEEALEGFLQEIVTRLQSLTHPDLAGPRAHAETAHQQLLADFSKLSHLGEAELNTVARPLAFNLARAFAASLLLEHAQWELKRTGPKALLVAQRFIAQGIVERIDYSAERDKESLVILST